MFLDGLIQIFLLRCFRCRVFFLVFSLFFLIDAIAMDKGGIEGKEVLLEYSNSVRIDLHFLLNNEAYGIDGNDNNPLYYAFLMQGEEKFLMQRIDCNQIWHQRGGKHCVYGEIVFSTTVNELCEENEIRLVYRAEGFAVSSGADISQQKVVSTIKFKQHEVTGDSAKGMLTVEPFVRTGNDSQVVDCLSRVFGSCCGENRNSRRWRVAKYNPHWEAVMDDKESKTLGSLDLEVVREFFAYQHNPWDGGLLRKHSQKGRGKLENKDFFQKMNKLAKDFKNRNNKAGASEKEYVRTDRGCLKTPKISETRVISGITPQSDKSRITVYTTAMLPIKVEYA